MASMNSTPKSLLERLRKSPDQDSWRRLFALYEPFIRQILRRQALPDADVDDIVQNICVTISQQIGQFDHSGRPGAFRLWVRTITVNRLRWYWRGRRHDSVPLVDGELEELEDPNGGLTRAWDAEHDAFIARQLLLSIEPEFSPATWLAFRRQVIDGLSAAQSARELRTSVNAVLIAKSRVLRRLRQEGRGLID